MTSDAPDTAPDRLAKRASTATQSHLFDSSGTSVVLIDTEEIEEDDMDHCGSWLVLREKHPFRIVWSVVVCGLLAYTASIFLYRFSFCSFHISPKGIDPVGEDDIGWKIVDQCVDALFWADLVIAFFVSYKDSRDREVDSMKLIARKYLSCYFWINLLACLPPEIFSAMVVATQDADDEAPGAMDLRATRVYRLQRISRLARLARVTRLIKIGQILSSSAIWTWFQQLRGVRVVNFIVGLFWTLHLLACGWYLCAALHGDVHQTWVGRRSVDVNDGTKSLLDQSPFEQWLVSMYFVLTVFTTVGFGDISAGTEAEILYVALTMLVGAVVHSIIISEVIGIVTSTDEVQKVVDRQMALVNAFEAHAQMSNETVKAIKSELTWRARTWAKSNSWSKTEMQDLLTGKFMPRWLIAKVPESLFRGRLVRSRYLQVMPIVPPRLPCILAIHLLTTEFTSEEIVYSMGDYPFNLFLVLSGTFAHVAIPSRQGGVDSKEDEEEGGQSPVERAASKDARRGSCDTFTFGLRTSRSSRSLAPAVGAESSCSAHLFPYRLFSHEAYFGEMEVFSGKPRLATTRCERRGTTLTLHKADYMDIEAMFPHFGVAWASAARRREGLRLDALHRLVHRLSCKHLAASQLQAFVRLRKSQPQQSRGVGHGHLASVIQADSTRHLRRKSLTRSEGATQLPRPAPSIPDDRASSAAVSALRREVDTLRKEMHDHMRDQKRLLELLISNSQTPMSI